MRAGPPSRAEILATLARELDILAVCRRFNLARDDLAQLFREAAALFEKADDSTGPWRLYVDGAARGNPGPAGAGAVLYDPAGQKKGEVSQYLGETTNNVAEYQAMLHGLQLALNLEVKNLQVLADSLLVVQQVKGVYQVKTPHLYPLFTQARQTLQKFSTCAISHLDRSLNQEADRLARQAIDRHLRKK